MKTILVPTDFSDTATNAAHYAIELSKQLKASKVILYHAYQIPVTAIDPMLPNLQVFNLSDQKDMCESEMQNFSEVFKPLLGGSTQLETVCEFNVLADGIEAIIENMHVDLVVMGITGGGEIDEVLVGSNTVNVARNITKPVIIVPPSCLYTSIRKVMLACDFKKVIESTPVEPIKELLNLTGSLLEIVNISKHKDEHSQKDFEALMIDTLFEGYDPKFHFIESNNFLNAINSYATDNEVDLIITIPKQHGWFESLFSRSHTTLLAFHSHLPLMVIH